MLRTISRPYQGRVSVRLENTYGNLSNRSVSYISGCVIDARLETGNCNEPKRSISKCTAYRFMSLPSDPVFHLEWVYDSACTFSLASYCITRKAISTTSNDAGDIRSLSFELLVNNDQSAPSSSQYILYGCKCKNLSLSGKRGDEYVYSADFSVKKVWSSASVAAASKWSPVAQVSPAYGIFNNAGTTLTITSTGSDYLTFITDNINISVNNNLSDLWTVNSPWKVDSIAGAMEITGSSDISIDNGGNAIWRTVSNHLDTTTAMTLNLFASGTHKTITLSGIRYDSFAVDVKNDGAMMIASKPFTAKTIAFS